MIDDQGKLSGIFSVNDIRRILHEEIPAGLIRARDIAMSRVVTTSPAESLTGVMRKLSLRGLEEIPVVDDEDPGKVLCMLSRRVVLARYASELERKKGVFAET